MVAEEFNPGEGSFLKSPPMKALKPKLQLSLSPPLLALRRNLPSNHDDAVLILHMDGGKRPDIAIEAVRWPLASSLGEEEEQERCSPSSTGSSDATIDSPTMSPESRPAMPLAIDLKSLAANALSIAQAPALDALRNMEGPTQKRLSSRDVDRSTGLHQQQHMPGPLPRQREIMSQAPNPVLAPPIFSYTC
ncbi:hypothetical protein PG991_009324 [Apiospora marii]|uniref:Uncharacterized protein n=1 Tax=Apiospora marii TaxID=335849 RepID=A0ABR1RLM9_9PEZI